MATGDERAELVRLVTYLSTGEGTEAEQDAALVELKARVPHPRVSDLIFWPDSLGYDRELSPDEIVDAALAHKPIEL